MTSHGFAGETEKIEGAIPLCAKGCGIRALIPFGVENESSVARRRARAYNTRIRSGTDSDPVDAPN